MVYSTYHEYFPDSSWEDTIRVKVTFHQAQNIDQARPNDVTEKCVDLQFVSVAVPSVALDAKIAQGNQS